MDIEGLHEKLCAVETALLAAINDVRQKVIGNGQPGLMLRMDRVEQDHRRCPWITGQRDSRTWDLAKIAIASAVGVGAALVTRLVLKV